MYSGRTLSTNLSILQIAFLKGVCKQMPRLLLKLKVFYFWILIVTDISLIGTKHVTHDLKTSHWDLCIWNWNRSLFLMFSYFPQVHIMSYSPYHNSIHRANSFTIIKDLLFLSAIFSDQRSTVVRCDQGSTGKEPSCRHSSHEVVPGIIGEATGCWTLHASWNTGQSIRKVVQN